MKRFLIAGIILIAITAISIFGSYWVNTQPIQVVTRKLDDVELIKLPGRNKSIIDLIESKGNALAPNYQDVVCTEFVIAILNELDKLSRAEMNEIRIITTGDLPDMIAADAPEIKGVQTALLKTRRGLAIDNFNDVVPGDFVQFWNIHNGKAYGHCGVVFEIDAGKTITLYSSHPFTDGYGKQVYLWPDNLFFVRLK